MELSDKQYTEVNSLLLQYWHGTKATEKFELAAGITFTVDHTEKDEVRFTVSFTDITDYCDSKPNTLSELKEFQPLVEQIERLLSSRMGEPSRSISFYKEPSIHMPMAQYSFKIAIKNFPKESMN